METINERFKSLRVNNRYSQAEFAIKLGLAQRTVSKIECGEITPTLRHIETMCRLFNVSADYLIFGKSDSVVF